MKILLIAIGTRGDVQPFITLGDCLCGHGHDVHIAAADAFAGQIATAGLTRHPLPMDFQALLQTPEIRGAMTSLSGKLKAYRWAAEVMNRQLDAMWQTGLDVAPDLILYHFKGAMAPYLGRRLSVPAWPVMLQPGFAPTAAYPQFLIASRSLGRWGNLASHKAIGALMRVGTRTMIRRWQKTGAPEIGPPMDVAAGFAPAGRPVRLHAYSAAITPLAADMPETERQTGYFFAEPDTHYTPPPELAKFVADGTPPVYIGFGSMPGIDPARVARAVTGALRQTGLRAVIATG